ncbi:hypothetical protein AO372_0223 [Moraxella catarrhalis]|nr:hypothetical protein AO372_0223 [Moraxella catarrhalis]
MTFINSKLSKPKMSKFTTKSALKIKKPLKTPNHLNLLLGN